MKQTIKQWELESGIKVLNPKGFRGPRNKVYNKKYSQGEFRRGLKRSYISIKTNKGLEFIAGGNGWCAKR